MERTPEAREGKRLIRRDRIIGSFLGLALGDALGAPHEGGFLAALLWRLLGTGGDGSLRWSDDTQMSLVLAEHLLKNSVPNLDLLAGEWAKEMEWKRGYGPGTRRVLLRVRGGEDWREARRTVWPEGSFGNGAAMRAAVLALRWSDNGGQRRLWTDETSRITHTHPLGIAGAQLIAEGTARALHTEESPADFLEALAEECGDGEFIERLRTAVKWGDDPVSPRQAARALGSGVSALDSVPAALYLGGRFANDFEGMIRFAAEMKGDVDTVAAMAGAVIGARGGVRALPESVKSLESFERLEKTALALAAIPEEFV